MVRPKRYRPEVLRWIEDELVKGTARAEIAKAAAAHFNLTRRRMQSYVNRAIDLRDATDALERKGERRTEADERRKRYAVLGAPPIDDPLACVGWIQRALVLCADEIRDSTHLPPEEIWEQLRRTGRVIAQLVPHERVYDAEQRIRRDAATIEEVEEDPELERIHGNGPSHSLRF